MSELRGLLTQYNIEKDYEIRDCDLIETILDDGEEVWADSDMDVHRWYNRQECVHKLNDTYIKFYKYIITGDACMEDMDLEYDLDEDFWIVEKKERVETVTYYE
jgi:hypothetical protein